MLIKEKLKRKELNKFSLKKKKRKLYLMAQKYEKGLYQESIENFNNY